MSSPSLLDSGRPPSAVAGRRRRTALLFGLAAYLAIAVTMFWNVLTLSGTRGTTCACSDTSLFAWFFEWPLVALTHGHNPFYSSAMFYPQGINLLSNTSEAAWSFVLLPVTAAFGPLASLNVALIVAPALSGLAAMWVAQRWVRSSLAAFVAGALYAFSPLVLFQSAGAHLMLTSLIVPPLVLACLDELFWRRRHSPIKVGIVLGALVVLQFFSGTEMLAILVIAVVASLVVIGAAAFVHDRVAAVAAIRHAAPGVGVASVISVVILAWPAWYALFGPNHFVGHVWPYAPPRVSLHSFFVAVPNPLPIWSVPTRGFIQPTYLGPPLVAALVVGLVVFHRSARLRAAIAMTVVIAWLSLGQQYPFSAWHFAHGLPILLNVFNERFAALLFLPAGLALAIVLDHIVKWRPDAVGVMIAFAVGVASITPLAIGAAHSLPYNASKVWEPLWYERNADALPPGQVILGFPFFNTSSDLLAVQAFHAMRYSLVGGTGPESVVGRQGVETPGYMELRRLASLSLDPEFPAAPTRTERVEVLAALRQWGVTYVVVPMAWGPPTSPDARSPSRVESWLASLLGPPSTKDAAWVWHLARHN